MAETFLVGWVAARQCRAIACRFSTDRRHYTEHERAVDPLMHHNRAEIPEIRANPEGGPRTISGKMRRHPM
ncbi:hypothetical protein [Cupriavidus necator]|uniref:hypothetical protein n=1 Tax=Cupriavidus necator TaxID=106590 RepID=UPI000F4EB84B|nr:hypothetical protein [Cupriavidus necator]